MAIPPLIFLVSDSAPAASFVLEDVNHDVDVNLHDPTKLPWLKFSPHNDPTTLFTILGIKINGGFDGKVEYTFVDSTSGDSLIKDLDSGNYQGEVFTSSNTIFLPLVSVDENGVFTTATDNFLATDNKVWFSSVPELPELSSTEWTVTVLTSTTFTLQESFTLPTALTPFASATFFNITTTETAVVRVPIILKESLT